MFPTHLLPPVLHRAAQLLAENPYTITLDEALDAEIGHWLDPPADGVQENTPTTPDYAMGNNLMTAKLAPCGS